MELVREARRQESNEELRKTFAQHANAFHSWLTDTRFFGSPPPPPHTHTLMHTHTQASLLGAHARLDGCV